MADRLVLVVVANGTFNTYPLPEQGEIVIGRGEGADVRIEERSISRRHARLSIGQTVTVEDLGSANGTGVRDTSAPLPQLDDATLPVREAPLAPGRCATVAPGDVITLGSTLVILRTAKEVQSEGTSSERRTASTPDDAEIVVVDPQMVNVFGLVEQLAASRLNVLFIGETGVGKDVLAERLHSASPRSERPFLCLNCASLSESLLESELFGHERGAFTGAVASKPGLLEVAHGGTVFLDEVGELPPATQAKLLRVIEERRIMRVGALRARPVDVRFVSATHRDLEQEVEHGTFRRDLYYRLNGITLRIPPLRERPSEIEPLARIFLAQAAAEAGKPRPELSAEALQRLREHRFAGNVRELKNAMGRAFVLAQGGPIKAEHLRLETAEGVAGQARQGPPAEAAAGRAEEPASAEEAERERIVTALERCAGNQTVAAKLLGISRRTLVTRLGQLRIPRPRKARDLV